MKYDQFDVSVIIPTVGRPELRQAVQSVREQTYQGAIEIIVVFDRAENDISVRERSFASGADVILFTGGSKRAGYARNRGIERASAEWTAFLDDDDVWLPNKLQDQFAAIRQERLPGECLVVGSRAIQRSVTRGRLEDIPNVPKELIRRGQSIEEYLFVRRRAGAQRNSFFTPTILAPTALCVEIPWDESLKRHQDWDWMVRLGQSENVRFLQVPQEAVVIAIGSGGSISAGTDWSASYAWATEVLLPLSRRTYVEFLAAQTLRYALHGRNPRALAKIGSSMLRTRTMPSATSLLVGASGLLRRSTLERLMHRFK